MQEWIIYVIVACVGALNSILSFVSFRRAGSVKKQVSELKNSPDQYAPIIQEFMEWLKTR